MPSLSTLTQLRVGLVNFNKFNHNFCDTSNPLCPINDSIEDMEHFLPLCHQYDDIRHDLLGTVDAVLRHHGLTNLSNKTLLQIILYGHEELSSKSHIPISERFQ